MTVPRWTFGEEPLDEQRAFATAVRDVTSRVLALEHASDEVRALTAELAEVSRRLDALLPADLRPRVGPDRHDDQRVEPGLGKACLEPVCRRLEIRVDGRGRPRSSAS